MKCYSLNKLLIQSIIFGFEEYKKEGEGALKRGEACGEGGLLKLREGA